MQDRPHKKDLLFALAKFLDDQVRDAIADPGLRFRVRIASNIAKVVALETMVEDTHDAAELEGLQAILPDVADGLGPNDGAGGRRRAIEVLNAALADAIRTRVLPDEAAARAHVKRTLIDKLSVVNPRFDTSLEIE